MFFDHRGSLILTSKLRVTPDVEPGFLRNLLPKEAPLKGEKWDDIFKDFETKILPGVGSYGLITQYLYLYFCYLF